MSLSDHVQLSISVDSVGLARAGFGIPLIVSHNAVFSGAEKTRSYTDLAGVEDDFATDSPEYLAASAAFSQNPHPTKVKIGKATLKPTQRYSISVTVRNSFEYAINVKGEGVTATRVTFTSDASATDAEIVAGLVSALNLVTGKNFTAAGASSPFTVTGDATGEWFSLEFEDATAFDASQNHADPGIATDLAAIKTYDNDWYGLYILYPSNAMVLATAAWAETNKKLYFADVNESDAITTAAGNSDTLDDLATLAYTRTVGSYYPNPAAMFGMAWMGRVLPLEPGSESWKFKKLTGIAEVTLTSTQRDNLIARNANSYEPFGSSSITFEGTTVEGEFPDTIRGLDWLEDDMQKSVAEVLVSNDKVEYEDEGIVVIQAAMEASLDRAVERKILARSPAPVVTVPKAADATTADKAARILRDMKFSGTLSGAIHKVIITGVVSV